MDKITVGVIGAGANTRKFHIPNLQAQPDVEIVGVANRSPESAARVAKEFGIDGVAESWRDIIEDDSIDAVCIGTWPYMHAPLTIAALDAGKHVLCEARMAMNASEAHEMLMVSRACPDQVAQIVPAPHTLAFDRTIIDLIGSGHIGELISLDAHIASGSNFPQYDSALHWRQSRDLSGNNIMSMGIWYEAIMRWIGPASTVYALGQSVVNHRRDDTGARVAMNIPDHIEVSSHVAQGGQMRLMVSTAVGLSDAVRVDIYGTEGTIRLVDDGNGLTLLSGRRGDTALAPVEIADDKKGGWRVEEEFINAIRGVEPVTHTDLVTGVKYMEWTDAVAMSMRNGRTIHLPLEMND